MKITKLETFATENVGFTRLTTEDGQQGWGQVSTYNSDITAQVLHRQVAPWVLGRSTDDLEALMCEVPEREHKFPGSYLRRAMAGVDTAIWDWRGKQAGKPVVALLGGEAGPIRTYGSSMTRDITPEAEAKRLARLREEKGFDAFKFRVGRECGHDLDQWPGRTEAIVPAVRQAVGQDVALLVDGNSGYSAGKAIEVGKMLEQHGVEHFEEPCPYWLMEETKQVTDALSLDVTGGEQDCDLQHWKRMIAMRAVDVIQPDILYLGGITRTLWVADMGAKAGLACTPHCANLSLVTLFTAHLLKALPNAGKYLEFSIEGDDIYPWQRDLFVEDPYRIEDGQLTLSDAPGWGVEVRPDWLARATYQSSEWEA
ncbi:mandelate racemase/muconate lactonizing enzyme family protein [Thalassobius sp. MITS945101]|uniref:mandelate racemase/muconate lactonizing enzyme family protein n=1 Tax=Thalassobius sp. MITS945101 TaxID=3096994 RepID=UPI00399AADD0